MKKQLGIGSIFLVFVAIVLSNTSCSVSVTETEETAADNSQSKGKQTSLSEKAGLKKSPKDSGATEDTAGQRESSDKTAIDSATTDEKWSGTPEVAPILPPDSLGTNQDDFNNLAWQEFIALNWIADPKVPGQPDPTVQANDFGTPNDLRPVVWESYKEASEVFLPDGKKPAPWGEPQQLPTQFQQLVPDGKLASTSRFGVKGLIGSNKFSSTTRLDLSEFGEAGTDCSWLTAQAKFNNNITLFEKRMNEDEFNYIYQNQLYDAAIQQTFAVSPGINLPDGSPAFDKYGKVGAIEIKASWIQIDDSSLWPLFKTSKAWVTYPTDKGNGKPTTPKLVTVGLVGLHIIHKTQKANQFVWATFEHVHNCPSTQDIARKELLPWYTYYNADCNSETDYYQCRQNAQPKFGTSLLHAPIQVVRTQPISSTTTNNIQALNQSVWNTIKKSNDKSVFLNYRLVNVLWPNSNTKIPPNSKTPLPSGNPQPPNQIVANTTLETYHQNLNCMDCHRNAPIASIASYTASLKITKAKAGSGSTLASDYSFLFMNAQTSKENK